MINNDQIASLAPKQQKSLFFPTEAQSIINKTSDAVEVEMGSAGLLKAVQ